VASGGRGLILIISGPESCYEKNATSALNLGTCSEFASKCRKKNQI
jgi:hypothetical protein